MRWIIEKKPLAEPKRAACGRTLIRRGDVTEVSEQQRPTSCYDRIQMRRNSSEIQFSLAKYYITFIKVQHARKDLY